MEQKYDYNLIDEKKRIQNKKNLKIYNSLDDVNLSIPLKRNKKDVKNLSFEFENQNFQIIDKKVNLINEEKSNSLNGKNDESIDKIKMVVNKIKLDDKRREYSKKNNLIEEKELFNINPFENSNGNIYTLLNSYYKDIDINFKNDNMNQNGKNFLHKNYFQEAPNKNKFPYPQNNMENSITYLPYGGGYQNQYSNNPFIFNDKRFQPYYFPQNAFSINNTYNYYFINNINKYSYNFHNNENKRNKKKINNIKPEFFAINIDTILKGIDTRTTVMIRHIPNKYTSQNILDEINAVCKDKYDFFYLPLDSENNCNLGYSFINFIHPLHIIYFYNFFKSRKWSYYNSYKECDLTYDKYQGKNELTNNIEKNMGKEENKMKMPMIFEVKNPPKIDLFKQYYNIIKEYQPKLLDEVNGI